MNIPAKLDKHRGKPELLSYQDSHVKDVNSKLGGAITARYWKGIGADGDNLVIVLGTSHRIQEVSLDQYTIRKE